MASGFCEDVFDFCGYPGIWQKGSTFIFKDRLRVFLLIYTGASDWRYSAGILEPIELCSYYRQGIVGIVIGYVSFLVFSALYVAGQIIDMQIGFGMVNVLIRQ